MITNFKKYVRALVALGFAATLAFSMSACAPSIPAPVGDSDATAVLDKINNAQKIYAEKALFSFGDNWTIYADDEEVGSVHGEYFKGIGDMYSLYTTNGHFVGGEEEKFTVIGAKARMFDMDKNEIGTVTRQVVSLLQKFDIERDGKVVGTIKQKMDIGFSANIVNSDDAVVWEVSRKKFSPNAKVTIERIADSEVTGMDALWAGLISNEIFESEQK